MVTHFCSLLHVDEFEQHQYIDDDNGYTPDDSPSDWCFPLPELPGGRELVMRILSTWGDRYYVGLTGIEIFTQTGEKARISKV